MDRRLERMTWPEVKAEIDAGTPIVLPVGAGTSKVLLVNWWEQVEQDDIQRIFGDEFPGWGTEHASITATSMLESFAPELVRTERKAAGGAERLVSYDIFPAPEDILWPNGIGFSALPANAETGKALMDLVIDRLTAIIDREFPEG